MSTIPVHEINDHLHFTCALERRSTSTHRATRHEKGSTVDVFDHGDAEVHCFLLRCSGQSTRMRYLS